MSRDPVSSMEYGTILLVEDDDKIQNVVSRYLEEGGYSVQTCSDGLEALQVAGERSFDLILLDIRLPKLDGLTVCAELRKKHTIPIIMLSGLDDSADKVLGLEVGADDYITKPCCLKELLARVRAALRRVRRFTPNPPPPAETDSDAEQWLRLDPKTNSVKTESVTAELTSTEYRLLSCLVKHRGKPMSRDRLVEEVWSGRSDIDGRAIDSHIRNIRQKMGAEGRLVETVRGLGYRVKID